MRFNIETKIMKKSFRVNKLIKKKKTHKCE